MLHFEQISRLIRVCDARTAFIAFTAAFLLLFQPPGAPIETRHVELLGSDAIPTFLPKDIRPNSCSHERTRGNIASLDAGFLKRDTAAAGTTQAVLSSVPEQIILPASRNHRHPRAVGPLVDNSCTDFYARGPPLVG